MVSVTTCRAWNGNNSKKTKSESKEGNSADLVNRKHVLQDSIKNYQQNTINRNLSTFYVYFGTIQFQRVSKGQKEGNQILKMLKEIEKNKMAKPNSYISNLPTISSNNLP